ncbi:hypothetical protein BJ508DRAFT_412215 [Ascobolus immersus RN42]|uniref:tRNA-splicing endonuclease subunit Sen15 domain-containing protein n=1 Tax=Ascobolus immersus RN42 TaxID=1160509 RepID=A0A3N4IFY9_ASCIM|nr:hypothetical protein BJ508DRAFT_412215 [Ascobolus immersus RN42]
MAATTSSESGLLPKASSIALAPPPIPPTVLETDPSYPLLKPILSYLALASSWTSITIHTHSPVDPSKRLPRAMISGIPPTNLYAELEDPGQKKEKKVDKKIRREWVLPSSLRENWTLRKWAEVFDLLGDLPPGENGEGDCDEKVEKKRILMGIVGGDGTVVFYFVHDGIVKPRQN